MNLLEIFVAAGTLPQVDRDRLSERLLATLFVAPGAPAEITERARAHTHVAFHETVSPGTATPTIGSPHAAVAVRVTLPGGHLSDAMRGELIGRIGSVLADRSGDGQPASTRPEPWIQIVEIPDGAIGGWGRIVSTDEIVGYVMTGRPPEALGEANATSAPATVRTVTDPICGMSVVLSDDALMLEHNGEVLGFCSPSCRILFASQVGATNES